METDTKPATTNTIFDLNVEDKDLLSMLAQPIRDSEKYWDKDRGLEKAREQNMKLWLPNYWKDKNVYDYQEEYLFNDPRIFISVETACSILNARIPQPEVLPAQENMISNQLAKDAQDALFGHSKKFRIQDIFRIGTRNLLLKRIGYIKLRFDEAYGKNGEIVPEVVAPEDLIIDQDARWGEIPRFMAQKIKNKTVEELVTMFPESAQKIYELIGVARFDKSGNRVIRKDQLGKKINLMYEVWFRYYDTENEMYGSGVAFVDEYFQHVIAKIRNPNWNYKDEGKALSNLLDYPMPPYFPINYLNDGTSYIDLTSMVEQARGLQNVVNRSGFQIMENSEQSGSGIVFNTNMISKEDMARLSGNPEEKIGVKGNVRDAMTRVPMPPLATYVIEQQRDARTEIDNVFATHDISRGERSQNKTLGQDQLQQQQDYTRMDDIARAIERTATLYYRYLLQMMKVYYTEDHWYKISGEDGRFDHIVMRRDLIEDGIDVAVEAGSMLPVNKQSQIKFVGDLTAKNLIDPLTLYEVGAGGVMPSPKKMLERLISWQTDPKGFAAAVKDEDFSRQAFMDIQILNAGKMPDLRDEISASYLGFFNRYMTTGDFMKQSEIVHHLYVSWLKICKGIAQQQLDALMTQQPTQDEITAANEKAAQAGNPAAQPQDPNAPPQAGGQPPQGGAPPSGQPQGPIKGGNFQAGTGPPPAAPAGAPSAPVAAVQAPPQQHRLPM